MSRLRHSMGAGREVILGLMLGAPTQCQTARREHGGVPVPKDYLAFPPFFFLTTGLAFAASLACSAMTSLRRFSYAET